MSPGIREDGTSKQHSPQWRSGRRLLKQTGWERSLQSGPYGPARVQGSFRSKSSSGFDPVPEARPDVSESAAVARSPTPSAAPALSFSGQCLQLVQHWLRLVVESPPGAALTPPPGYAPDVVVAVCQRFGEPIARLSAKMVASSMAAAEKADGEVAALQLGQSRLESARQLLADLHGAHTFTSHQLRVVVGHASPPAPPPRSLPAVAHKVRSMLPLARAGTTPPLSSATGAPPATAAPGTSPQLPRRGSQLHGGAFSGRQPAVHRSPFSTASTPTSVASNTSRIQFNGTVNRGAVATPPPAVKAAVAALHVPTPTSTPGSSPPRPPAGKSSGPRQPVTRQQSFHRMPPIPVAEPPRQTV